MKPRSHFENAKAHIEAREWKEASEEATKAIEQDSNRFAYYARAIAKKELGDLNEALADATIAIDFGSTDALATRGTIYNELNQFDNAIVDLKKAIGKDPTSSDSYFYLGCVYARQEKIDLAIDAFKKALALDSTLKQRLTDDIHRVKNKDKKLAILISSVLNRRSDYKGILYSLSKSARPVSITRGDFNRLAQALEAQLKEHKGEVKVAEKVQKAYLQDSSLQQQIVENAKAFPHIAQLVQKFNVGIFCPADRKLYGDETILDSDKKGAEHSSHNRFGHPAIGNSLL